VEKKLEGLSGRLRVGTERRTPTLTWQGKLFSITLLLMAFGGVLASSDLGNASLPGIFPKFTWAHLGIVLTALPLFSIIITWIIRWFSGKESHSVESMLFNRWDDVTTIETESDPDPTSIEFQRIFQDVISEALSDQNHRLVLVIDNLDRLPPNDAMHLWRTLQTFINKNEHDQNAWAGKLWTLVPYDREILKKHFSEIRIANTSDFPLVFGNNANNELGHFEKIFDTSLHVPTPAPTLWQKFFKDLLVQAFPNEDDEALNTVIRVMEAKGGLDYTPRTLKKIINSAGPIYIQWRSEFSLADIIYYVLQKHSPSKWSDIVDPSIAAVLGSNYRHKIDAIEYNAPIEIARQVEFISSIEVALPKNKNDLMQLEQQSSNFGQLLTWTCQKKLPYWDKNTISASARNLIESKVFERLAPEHTANLRNVFISSVEHSRIKFSVEDLASDEISKGLIHICTICQHLPTSKAIMQAISSSKETFHRLKNVRGRGAIAKSIQTIALAIHEIHPSIFDDQLVQSLIDRVTILSTTSEEEIEKLKAVLTSHQE
jgi:hypothetical protein